MDSFYIEKLAVELRKEFKKPKLNEVKKVFLAEKIRIIEEYLEIKANHSVIKTNPLNSPCV